MKVQVLSSDIIARIAAGEVVERPASAVKELFENALDAGATRVEVLLKDGGKSLIQVKDNGSGIERADLDTVFTRHATSKIRNAGDLDALLSLGFRGEALYSIGAVSEVTVKTKTEGAREGWELFLRGGRRERVSPAALAARGTEIMVEEIFFNTPARKKFLKSDSAEFNQTLNIFVPYALFLPAHHLTLTHNNRTVYDLAPTATFAERAARTLNLNAAHIIEADDAFPQDRVVVKLVLGDINIQRPRRDLQYLFVNGRPVQSRNLLFQINDIYRLVMPEGAHPFFAVFVTLPAEDVDVNIHPAKREVRIRQESRLGGLLRGAVERALMTRGGAREVPDGDIFTFGPPSGPGADPGTSRDSGIPVDKIVFSPGQKGAGASMSSAPMRSPRETDSPVAPVLPLEAKSPTASSGQAVPFTTDFMDPKETSLNDRFSRARLVGTFARKYHLFEEGGALFVVDQHAAQERIMFERFLRQIEAGQVEVQHLLTPVLLKATPQEMLAWEASQEKLKIFGFDTTRLDASTLAIQTTPVLISNPEQPVRTLLGDEALARVDKDTVARRACRASVMAGDKMSQLEAAQQLKELLSCKDPFTCPHGRPVFIEIKSSFLDRQFLRT